MEEKRFVALCEKAEALLKVFSLRHKLYISFCKEVWVSNYSSRGIGSTLFYEFYYRDVKSVPAWSPLIMHEGDVHFFGLRFDVSSVTDQYKTIREQLNALVVLAQGYRVPELPPTLRMSELYNLLPIDKEFAERVRENCATMAKAVKYDSEEEFWAAKATLDTLVCEALVHALGPKSADEYYDAEIASLRREGKELFSQVITEYAPYVSFCRTFDSPEQIPKSLASIFVSAFSDMTDVPDWSQIRSSEGGLNFNQLSFDVSHVLCKKRPLAVRNLFDVLANWANDSSIPDLPCTMGMSKLYRLAPIDETFADYFSEVSATMANADSEEEYWDAHSVLETLVCEALVVALGFGQTNVKSAEKQ